MGLHYVYMRGAKSLITATKSLHGADMRFARHQREVYRESREAGRWIEVGFAPIFLEPL